MAQVRFTVQSPRPTQEVFRALVDFSSDRPSLWPAIDRSVYTVHAVGDGWAEVTEGSDVMGGIWAREHYEWQPGHVRARIVESNFWHPGGIWEATITPAVGGGSRVAVVRDRVPRIPRARVLELMLRVVGSKVLAADLGRAPAVSGATP